jgi:hypothetical protein
MDRSFGRRGDKSNAYMILVQKPEIKRSLENPRCMWVDIKTDMVYIGCGGME